LIAEPGTATRLRSRSVFLGARLFPNLLGVATTAVLTRLLTPTDYGTYAFGLSIVYFLTIGVYEWLGLSVMRLAPTVARPVRFFGTVLTCFGVLSALCAIGTLAVVLAVGFENTASLAAACLLVTIVSAWVELKQRLQMAEQREADYFWLSSGRGALVSILVCGTAYFYRSAAPIVFALAAGILLAGLLVRDPRLDLFKFRYDGAVFRTLVNFGLPLSISVGLGTILMSVDKWLLQALAGSRAVGLFSASVLVAQTPILALAGGVGPFAYSMAVRALEFHSREAANAQLAQNFVVLLGIVIPSAVGIIALTDNLAHLMVGAAYWQSAILLAPWLAPAAVFASIRVFYVDVAFQLAHKTSPLVWIMSATVAINVGLDLWLIPKLGVQGAAIGGSCALLAGLVIGAIASRSVFRLPIPVIDIAKVVASAGIMFIALHELTRYSGFLALACQIGVGSMVYGAGLIAFNLLGIRNRLMQYVPRRVKSAAGS
jgi:O-antigen/teichoic acid export membrane protein